MRVTKAFGIRGYVRVALFSKNFSRYKKIYDKNGNEFSSRVMKFIGNDNAVISIEGVDNRNVAESLKNCLFYVKKSDLAPIDKNEFYLCDLIGREIQVIDSDIKCKIVNAGNFGACDLIEVSYEDDTFFVPFTLENFPHSDKQIIMTLEAFNGFKS